jgi:hypothetical protein
VSICNSVPAAAILCGTAMRGLSGRFAARRRIAPRGRAIVSRKMKAKTGAAIQLLNLASASCS